MSLISSLYSSVSQTVCRDPVVGFNLIFGGSQSAVNTGNGKIRLPDAAKYPTNSSAPGICKTAANCPAKELGSYFANCRSWVICRANNNSLDTSDSHKFWASKIDCHQFCSFKCQFQLTAVSSAKVVIIFVFSTLQENVLGTCNQLWLPRAVCFNRADEAKKA